MNTLFLALFRPVKAFSKLKTEAFSAFSWVIVLLLMLVNLILNIPVGEKILQITVSEMSLTQYQLDTMAQVAYKMRYLQIAGTLILYIIMFLCYALLLNLLVYLAKAKDKLFYKKALQLLVCCYLIVTIGDLVNTTFIYIRGLDAINSLYEISLTGLNLLTSVEQIGAVGYSFLSYINPFQLWFVVLLSVGLGIFTDMKRMKTIIISVLFWLITIMIPVLFVYFSQATLAKTGVM